MTVELSIIVPLYNEEDNVRPMYEAIRAAVLPLGRRSELIFVDDGSRDATFARALELPRHDGLHLRLIKLRRNAGQTAAMVAGIDHARGEVLVTMDGDLQNDPRRHPPVPRQDRRGLRPRRRLAPPAAGPLVARAAVEGRQLADRQGDRRADQATMAARSRPTGPT